MLQSLKKVFIDKFKDMKKMMCKIILKLVKKN